MKRSLFGHEAVSPLSSPGVDLVRRDAFTSSGDIVPSDDSINAAAPETCGHAIDVPDQVAIAVSLDATAEVMADPGAKMSTQLPTLLKDERASDEVVAPTVIAVDDEAGE
jgi:hypothetical protein